jgi:hypothetical protein
MAGTKPLQAEELLPVSDAMKQATAEIVHCIDWDDATDYRTTGAFDRERDRVLAIIRRLSSEQARPVVHSELVEQLVELREFLDGSGSLDGLFFGDTKDVPSCVGFGRRTFWWRDEMNRRIDRALSALTTSRPVVQQDKGMVERAFREGFACGDFAGGGQADPRTVDLAWPNSNARAALSASHIEHKGGPAA